MASWVRVPAIDGTTTYAQCKDFGLNTGSNVSYAQFYALGSPRSDIYIKGCFYGPVNFWDRFVVAVDYNITDAKISCPGLTANNTTTGGVMNWAINTTNANYPGIRYYVCYGAWDNTSANTSIPHYSTLEEALTALDDGIWEDIPENTDPYSGIDGIGEITGGGTGTVGIPGFPPISATSTGILGLFAPSTSEMLQLSDYMWTDFGGTGTTEVDVLKEIVQALKRTISNPLDYVTGLSIIPSQGLSVGASQTIRFGFTSSGVSMPRLTSQYFSVDCGSINFDTLCGDTFLDYAPYSKFSIYLPYIGCKTLDANDCVGHTIGVVYHGDVVTGGVTAYVTKDGSVMYQYSGCCSLNIPLSADSWGTTISGAVQVATSMIASASTPGVAGVAKTAIAGASNVATNPSMLSPQVQHSGAISGGAGCMGVQYPYIIREAVRFHSTRNFNSEHGYPAFYYRKLANVSGFTIVYDAHIEGINATADEIAEIEELLKNGVIL